MTKQHNDLQNFKTTTNVTEGNYQVREETNTKFALFQAIEAGHWAYLHRILYESESLTLRGDDGSTPLHCAARAGKAEIVDYLLSMHVDIEAVDLKGRTPLFDAVENRNLETVKLLLNHGARVATKDYKGRITISGAKEISNSLLEILITKLATENKQDLGSWLFAAVASERVQAVQMLLSLPETDPNCQKRYPNNEAWGSGKTPLHIAADRGYTAITALLLERPDININVEDRFHCTALHLATQNGHEEVVRLFLNHPKIDCNATGLWTRTTPLHKAVAASSVPLIKMLLEHPSVDVNAKGPDGQTPLHFSCRIGDVKTTMLLLCHDKIQVNIKDQRNRTPLLQLLFHDFLFTGNWTLERQEILKLLLQFDDLDTQSTARTFLIDTDGSGRVMCLNALEVAKRRGLDDAVSLLIAHGAVDSSSEGNISTGNLDSEMDLVRSPELL